MSNDRIERNVTFLTPKEQSEILWAFIIDFRTLTQSLTGGSSPSAAQIDELSSLCRAVRNISHLAKEKFDKKIYRSFVRLESLIAEFLQAHRSPQRLAAVG
ncbi:MAG: hypothetical protein H6849_03650 [Alphaproteobacteria bacterium]|nr:MAG: hypothetical protein H6849_03650 [Alphaproteobacteria bacterium]